MQGIIVYNFIVKKLINQHFEIQCDLCTIKSRAQECMHLTHNASSSSPLEHDYLAASFLFFNYIITGPSCNWRYLNPHKKFKTAIINALLPTTIPIWW
jgi:hypothetical protein